MPELTLDQFWRCPTCGNGFGMGSPGKITEPPKCSVHGEMEQVTAEGFNADVKRRPDDGDEH